MNRKSVYIAASSQHVGKTTMTLGMLAALKAHGYKVGYCKPLGQQYIKVDKKRVDKDAVLFASTMNFKLEADIHSPVILGPGDTADYLDDKIEVDFKEKIHSAADALHEENEIVVYEGTGHPGVGSVVDLSNAVVARELKTSVILVIEGGIGNTIDRLTLCESMFRNKGVKVAGVIINKVLPAKMEKVDHYISKALKKRGIELLGLIPYDEVLVYPSMRHVLKAVKGKVIAGEEFLGNVVHDTIAGASLHFEVEPSNLLLIVNSERFHEVLDKLEKVFEERNIDPALGGLIVTGNSPIMEEDLERVSHFNIPVATTFYDTYDAAIHLGDLVAKIDTKNPKKVSRAIKLFKEHIDMDKVEKLLGF